MMKSIKTAALFETVRSSSIAHQKPIPDEEKSSGIHLREDAIALAEKLVVRLPADGAVIVLGSLSTASEGPLLANQLALALQVISSKPVLLIDASPQPNADNQEVDVGRQGLTDVLCGSVTLKESLNPSGRQDLKTITFGTRIENATELIISSAFRELIKEAKEQFHWVIIYCSSLLHQKESATIISRADSLIATLKRGEGRGRDVRAIRELCSQVKTEFAGIVLT
jgi:hypothetical protein